ncbi:MAG: PIG-L family deacetylase [Microbacterium sp.]
MAIVQACGGVAAADPAALPLARVSQWAVDAIVFLASTAQCSDIPSVVARDAAGTAPDGTVFSSPLQFVEPPCPAGTVVSFWAHYDDDLIFANPTLQHALDSGQCLRTMFFSNSDSGKSDAAYAANREVGIRAAYDVVRGASGPWVDRTVTLRNGITLILTRPEGDSRISLLFLRLPDGGLSATGYQRTGWESLPKLVAGDLSALHTIGAGQEVTFDGLQNMVVELVNGYGATAVLASLPGFADGSGGDHPDHRAVGRIVAAPVDAGLIDPGIVQYAMGYPVANLPANIDTDPLTRKLRAFAMYAAHDPVVYCSDDRGCLNVRRFGDMLRRQYLVPHGDLSRVSD